MRVHHNCPRPASEPAAGSGHRVIATSVPERHSALPVTDLDQNPLRVCFEIKPRTKTIHHGLERGKEPGTECLRPLRLCYRCHAGSSGARGPTVDGQGLDLNIQRSDFSKW